jgi:hypothetical protein
MGLGLGRKETVVLCETLWEVGADSCACEE